MKKYFHFLRIFGSGFVKKKPKKKKKSSLSSLYRGRGEGEGRAKNPSFPAHFTIFQFPHLTVHLMTRAKDHGAGN